VIKGLVALFGATFVLAGVAAMLAPSMLRAQFEVNTQSAVGLGTLRGVLGGLMGGSGVMMLLGLVRRETAWLRATAVVIGAAATGRLLGIVFDGPTPGTLLPLLVEATVVMVMLAANHRLRAGPARGAASRSPGQAR
jgi:Domain of unknown function (DUF4345)